jgi:hypothetical protein
VAAGTAAAAAEGAAVPAYSEAFLRGLLHRENAARLSPATQALYAAAEARQDTDWMEVTDALQRRLLREAGVPPLSEAAALRALRAATHTYPALASIPLYVRHQRARAGELAPGPAAPDVPLLTLAGERTSLLAAAQQLRAPPAGSAARGPLPLLLCAGSVS